MTRRLLGYDAEMRATWKPHEKHGRLTRQSDLPDSVYAFPKERKEPLTDARHVRNAIARFDQVTGVSEDERALAFANIRKAARHYGIDVSAGDWHDLGEHPQANRKAISRRVSATRKRTGAAKKSARKGAATRKRTGVAKKAAKKAVTTRKKRSR